MEGQHLPAADLQERLWRGSELCQTQTTSIEKILTHACHGGEEAIKGEMSWEERALAAVLPPWEAHTGRKWSRGTCLAI